MSRRLWTPSPQSHAAPAAGAFRDRQLPVLLAAPTTPYDIPLRNEPNVARDQLAVVAKALYSVPHRYVGHVLSARADQQLVRF
ncbi:MAG: hypothetical protein M3P18_21200 [Actinomycetota bacterium]|nr:hypothetical protein [Actinomycetota bacterium]